MKDVHGSIKIKPRINARVVQKVLALCGLLKKETLIVQIQWIHKLSTVKLNP